MLALEVSVIFLKGQPVRRRCPSNQTFVDSLNTQAQNKYEMNHLPVGGAVCWDFAGYGVSETESSLQLHQHTG